jgi:hypothetical protein
MITALHQKVIGRILIKSRHVFIFVWEVSKEVIQFMVAHSVKEVLGSNIITKFGTRVSTADTQTLTPNIIA